MRSWLRSSRVVPLRTLVDHMVWVIAPVASTTLVHLRSGVLDCGLGLVYSWHGATSAIGAEMPVPIARSADSAWYVGRVMIGAGSTLGKVPGVGPLGRHHGLRWSRRRVLRCKSCIGLVRRFPLLATEVVSLPGLGRFGIG